MTFRKRVPRANSSSQFPPLRTKPGYCAKRAVSTCLLWLNDMGTYLFPSKQERTESALSLPPAKSALLPTRTKLDRDIPKPRPAYIFYVVDGFPEFTPDTINQGPWCGYIDTRGVRGAYVGYIWDSWAETTAAHRFARLEGYSVTRPRRLTNRDRKKVTWLGTHVKDEKD